jgi:predicted nucleotidyltransferase
MIIKGVNFDEAKLAAFCREHGITRMSLFGSILTDHFGPESDIDLLVQFDPSRRVSLFDIGGMIADLRDLIGRDVDLRTFEDLSVYFRDDVVRKAQPLYAAA